MPKAADAAECAALARYYSASYPGSHVIHQTKTACHPNTVAPGPDKPLHVDPNPRNQPRSGATAPQDRAESAPQAANTPTCTPTQQHTPPWFTGLALCHARFTLQGDLPTTGRGMLCTATGTPFAKSDPPQHPTRRSMHSDSAMESRPTGIDAHSRTASGRARPGSSQAWPVCTKPSPGNIKRSGGAGCS